MSSPIIHTFGTLSSAPNGIIIEHIFEHVRSVLLDLKFSKQENENAITNRFCKALEFKKPPESPYFFHHQNLEDDTVNTSTDFSAFGTYAYLQALQTEDTDEAPPLIKFEAKRLSTGIPKKREREYVIGEYEDGVHVKNSGGIERFKNERHGKDVQYAGIIGYVQTGIFSDWLTKINSWISDEIRNPRDAQLTWTESDLLITSQEVIDGSMYRSLSQRVSGNMIAMLHLWAIAT